MLGRNNGRSVGILLGTSLGDSVGTVLCDDLGGVLVARLGIVLCVILGRELGASLSIEDGNKVGSPILKNQGMVHIQRETRMTIRVYCLANSSS